jgi:hypothetical protein
MVYPATMGGKQSSFAAISANSKLLAMADVTLKAVDLRLTATATGLPIVINFWPRGFQRFYAGPAEVQKPR